MKNFRIILFLIGITILGSCQKEEIADETLQTEGQLEQLDSKIFSNCRYFQSGSDELQINTSLSKPTFFCKPNNITLYGTEYPTIIPGWDNDRGLYTSKLILEESNLQSSLEIYFNWVSYREDNITFQFKLTYQAFDPNTNTWAPITRVSRNWDLKKNTPDSADGSNYKISLSASPFRIIPPKSKVRLTAEIWYNDNPNSGRYMIFEFDEDIF